mgnify:FL=1
MRITKLIFIITISVLLPLFASSFILAKANINPKTLLIFVCNKEYKGEQFLKDDLLYCDLDVLDNLMGIKYQIDGQSLFLSNGVEYDYKLIIKGKKIYVPVTNFSQSAGFIVSYDESSNILDISYTGVFSFTELVTTKRKTVKADLEKDSNFLIKPGKSIGDFSLGLHLKEFESWGKPDLEDYNGKYFYIYYRKYNIALMGNPSTGKVSAMFTESKSYADKYKIGLGTGCKKVFEHYPDGEFGEMSVDTYFLFKDGIAFEFDDKGYVNNIMIFEPVEDRSSSPYINSGSSYRSSNSDPSATQCLGITEDGHRCKRKTTNSSGYCWQHQDQAR